MFARQGVPLETISRAVARDIETIESLCREKGIKTTLSENAQVFDLQARLRAADRKIANLEATDHENPYRGVAELTEREAGIVYYLSRRGLVSKEKLYEATCGGKLVKPRPEILSVLMVRIRKKLAPYNIEINTLPTFGYEMTRADVAALDKLAGQKR